MSSYVHYQLVCAGSSGIIGTGSSPVTYMLEIDGTDGTSLRLHQLTLTVPKDAYECFSNDMEFPSMSCALYLH